MPKTLQIHSSGHIADVNSATTAELTRLPAEVLRLRLSSRNIITTGKKVTPAFRLYKVLHTTNPTMPANLASSSSVMVLSPTSTFISNSISINSSTPATNTDISTSNSTTYPFSITDLPPATQQQFSSLMQQYICSPAPSPAKRMVQPNLSSVYDCDNSNIPTSTHLSSFNADVFTFMQVSMNGISAADA